MSNTAVGGVYQAIIEEVINSSRVDFEESGVEESVLEELRKVSNQSVSLNLFPSRSLCRGRRLGSVGSPSTVSPRAAGAHACDLHTKEAQGKETNKKKRRENRDSIRESQRCAQKAAGLDGDELQPLFKAQTHPLNTNSHHCIPPVSDEITCSSSCDTAKHQSHRPSLAATA
jgi:hypothetical protein